MYLDFGETLVLNGIEHNGGGHYNNTDGTFTCPKTGIYFFTLALYGWVNENEISYDLTSSIRGPTNLYSSSFLRDLIGREGSCAHTRFYFAHARTRFYPAHAHANF